MFEAVGLRQDVIDEYFTWTASRIGGVGMDVIAQEVLMRHRAAFPDRARVNGTRCDVGRPVSVARRRRVHLFNPESIHRLQKAVRTNNYATFKEYARADQRSARRTSARCAACWISSRPKPIPIEEVESVESIMKRFKTGAMCYGSISKEAHETLAIAMNRIGGKSNTGEGGEDPERYEPMRQRRLEEQRHQAGGVGPFRRHEPLPRQRARSCRSRWRRARSPAKAASCPARKVYPWIAKTRHTTPGVGLISPPPHHDIYSIEDLAELIHDLKNAQPRRAHQREAGRGSRRRHHRGGRRQGARGRRADQRSTTAAPALRR